MGSQQLQRALWSEALEAVQQAVGKVQGNEIKAIAGKLADAESMISLKVGPPALWHSRLSMRSGCT